ncbi:AcrR family transcriptional regulator [Kitasatospora sp. GP30]|uniref:TetR/AcrR family transcriptional regulator n=1 Tax=Kitasatospora sp. GP30 TaxID=3035084 RepID=UPI000C6FFC67|nr:TetR/AcrR family transcriptional regulator [Kitasatospora sp. GP30]MDH6142310.1 AcrR family transcriptional regulator [Kitasatospora sp. GP30]
MSDAALPPLPAGVLRAPQQQRSREKVARILAATAQLLERHDHGQIGTKLIAAEAQVSIGVLYRFFPDKHAIFSSLMVHWLDQYLAAVESVVDAELPPTPSELGARLISAQVRVRRGTPGHLGLWFHAPPPPELREYDQAVDRRIAAVIHAALVRGYGYPDTAAFRLRTELVVAAAAQLLITAFKLAPDGDPRVIGEIQLMLDGWLFARASDTGS